MAEESAASQSMAMPAQGEFCWTEIASNDAAEKCKAFYSEIFGWKFKDSDSSTDGMKYDEFSTGADYPAGGLYQADPAWFGGNPPPPHFMIYVAVDDVDANSKKATELGATIIREPMDIPNVGRFCVIQDPTGAVIATFGAQKGGANG